MSVCGRCRGRRFIQPIRGIGQVDCPACKGTGIKLQRSSLGQRGVSVPLTPGARCIVCNDPAVHNHHVIAQQRLARFLDATLAAEAKADSRGVTPLCFACHDAVEKGALLLEPDQLHPRFPAFVSDYDLAAALPRHLAGVGAA